MKKHILLYFFLISNLALFAQNKPTQKEKRPKLAIEYFAEYNIYEEEIGSTHKTSGISLYNFEEAKLACPKGWHLPTQEEWAGLFPYNDILRKGSAEPITVNGVTKNYYSKYIRKNNITYAIRFMRDPDMETDKKMLSAYRYETKGSIEQEDIRLKITVRYLGPAFNGTINDIADETYWNTNNQQDIIREFPSIKGEFVLSGKLNSSEYGNYWSSSTPIEEYYTYRPRYVLILSSEQIGKITSMSSGHRYGDDDKRWYMQVRCIKDKE